MKKWGIASILFALSILSWTIPDAHKLVLYVFIFSLIMILASVGFSISSLVKKEGKKAIPISILVLFGFFIMAVVLLLKAGANYLSSG